MPNLKFKIVAISETGNYGAFKNQWTITAKSFASEYSEYDKKTTSVVDSTISFHTDNPNEFQINSEFELRFI